MLARGDIFLLGAARDERPDHRHRGAAPDGAVELDLAAVAADDLRGDGEAEPGALAALLGGEERIEDLVVELLGDAAAVVDDLDVGGGGLGAGADRHVAPARAGVER